MTSRCSAAGRRAFPADQAEAVLSGLPQIVMNHPERVFRNPEELAQARQMRAEQRESFIDLHGGDVIVVPGDQVNATLMDFHPHNYGAGRQPERAVDRPRPAAASRGTDRRGQRRADPRRRGRPGFLRRLRRRPAGLRRPRPRPAAA